MSEKRNIAAEALSICMQTGWYGGKNIPVLLEAVPGCGKTSVVQQMADILAKHLQAQKVSDTFSTEVFVLPQTMPEDISGVPSPDLEARSLERLPLGGIRRLINAQYGVAFFDEITSSSQQTGAACMTLIQDGAAGDVKMPDTIARVAACNPPSCAAAGREFTAPEINRMVRIEWKLTNDDFFSFLAGGQGAAAHVRFLPPDWEKTGGPRARTLVRAFLSRDPKLINTMESNVTTAAQASQPWASQRAWFNVVRLLSAVFALGEEPNSELAYVLVKGMVGDGIVDQFIGWLREMDLPDPEDILKVAMNPKKNESDEDHAERILKSIPKPVMERPDKLRICLEAVAIAANQKDHSDYVDRWTAAWRVIDPILEKKPDNALQAAKILSMNMPAGAKIPATTTKLFEVLKAMQLTGART